MQKFTQISDTHVQVTDGAISTDGTFYEKVYNFTRIPNEQITMTRYYRYLELCKMVQLGISLDMVKELFKPMVDFVHSGNNDLNEDQIAEVKIKMAHLYANIVERMELATKSIYVPLEISGLFWQLDNEDVTGYDATLFHNQKQPLMCCTQEAKSFFLCNGMISVQGLTDTYSSDLEKLNTVREYCDLIVAIDNIEASMKLEEQPLPF